MKNEKTFIELFEENENYLFASIKRLNRVRLIKNSTLSKTDVLFSFIKVKLISDDDLAILLKDNYKESLLIASIGDVIISIPVKLLSNLLNMSVLKFIELFDEDKIIEDEKYEVEYI